MMRRRIPVCALMSASVLYVLAACAPHRCAGADGKSQKPQIDFERQVRPILENRCWDCHGADSQESGLRLDRRSALLRGGDSGLPAVVPGKPEKSRLIEVVKHLDPDVKMPPDDDKLPAREIAVLEQWIREGAVWPGQMQAAETDRKTDHWAFQPIVRPPVPNATIRSVGDGRPNEPETGSTRDAATDRAAPTNPVDAFLFQRLQREGLAFAEPADPRTLIRRVSIVLTGLPPTPDETAEFLKSWERDPDAAYAALVERLLDSPHFGERWAQHWLDVIRWAETNGSESNLYRKNAWIYRDYVVRSFNEDKPYDQFIREQLAGDTMGVGDATGFLVAGPHVPPATVGREPAAIRKARADRMDEIMQTVGVSILGITIGCARCHNHKFDPISLRDYYAMTAVFQDIEFGSRFPELAPDHPRRRRGAELWRQINAQRAKLRRYGGWEEDWGAYREWHFSPIETTAIRIRFKTRSVGIDELQVFGPAEPNRNLALADDGTKVSGYPAKGIEDRNPVERVNDGEFGTMGWRAKVEQDAERPWLRLDFSRAVVIDRMRMSANRAYFYETDYLEQKPYLPRYEFDMDVLQPDGSWKPWVGTWYVNKKLAERHPERASILAEVQRLIATLQEEGPQPSFIGRLIRPKRTFVLLRGNPETPRDEVAPAAPEILGGDLGLSSDTPGPQRRTRFAEWATNPNNPLTARVMANRIWMHVFGRGIVTTPGDFGHAGARPTHPELLDWLAAEFMQPSVDPGVFVGQASDAGQAPARPWSVKHLIRLLVTSRAFRQSSRPRPEGMAIDPDAALLWRFPPRRVEAEVIRDSILLASGCLDLRLGGRSYRIFNVKKTYAQWEVVDNYGPQTWRRMLYQERMRRVDDGIFTAFDFPDFGQVCPKRPVSTTPLQSLNLLNSPFAVDQSRRLAERALKDSGGDLARAVDRCFELLLCRPPTDDERNDCLAVARAHGLPMVCRSLINSNEFVFLP